MDINPSLDIDLEAMTKLPSGLLFTDLEVGDGEVADSGSTAQVGYHGYFTSGDMFDSGSFSFTVGAGQVVAGFDQGISGMQVGGRRQLVIPSHLGYGDQDRGPIPGGSTLVFVVDLEAVSR
jgi:peptidylprolyl isomerase